MSGHQFTPRYGDDRAPTAWNPAEWDGKIPRPVVRAAVSEVFARFTVVRSYWDPEDWDSEIDAWALEHGSEHVVVWETNRPKPVHEALRRFVVDLAQPDFTHDGCPITRTHIANARKLARPGQRYVIGKPNEHQKIDMAVCSVLAHEARADALSAGWTDAPKSRRKMIVFR